MGHPAFAVESAGTPIGSTLFVLRPFRSELRDDVLLDGAIEGNHFPLDFEARER
jgi:hypothetical protein